MGQSDYYRHGSWNVICDRCGFKYKAEQLRKEWTGLRTCDGGGTNQCWEVRHPQDFVKGRRDKQAPPWTQPEPTDSFTSNESFLLLESGDSLLLESGDKLLLE